MVNQPKRENIPSGNGLPTGERSALEDLWHQPAALPGAGGIIAERHRFFWLGGSRTLDIDSRRLRIEFGDFIDGAWIETRYRRERAGQPFERI